MGSPAMKRAVLYSLAGLVVLAWNKLLRMVGLAAASPAMSLPTREALFSL